MQGLKDMLIEKAVSLLESGEVSRVVGWKKGEFCYDESPNVFETKEDIINNFVYDSFSGANLSKYLINESKKEGKTLVFLKPCDTYSFNQLIKEHRVDREKVYVVAIEYQAFLDIQ